MTTLELSANAIEGKWRRVQARLRAELGEDVFTSWFGRVELEACDDGLVQVSVPTKFLRNWLQSHYSERLLACCSAELAGVERLEFRVRQPHDAAVAERRAAERPAPKLDAPKPGSTRHDEPASRDSRTGWDGFEGSPLEARFTFSSFIVGASNRLAHAAALQVTEAVADHPLRYNPLYLHAKVGLGKTHLLHAIAWEVRRRKPKAKLLYLTAERFMYSFAEALQTRDAVAYKDMIRAIDILLIDDIEFLQGRTFQQEFCHTLNSLIDGGKQVVVAADCPPMQLESFDARMRSRLSGGLVAEVGALDYDLRCKVLKRRAAEKAEQERGFGIPEPVIEFLASQLTESGRELEGAITRIHAAFQLTAQPITVESAEQIIGDLIRGKEPRRVKIDDILRVVMKHFGVNRGDLLSSRRNRSIVRPRQIGMYLAKSLTARSLPEIGRRFGGRDHTTVLHAIRKIESLLAADAVLKDEIEVLKRLLKE
ncbi:MULTISPECIES: chromosomal replication initiator protein DnaA [Rhodomicrobium]|uniref:chromosomal replication initiator protein DnaA n=1 Tax=Rhodomicrobium sp. R_RK_3 TaxID=2029567 RepID=UPI001FD9108A|nr:MULTISPECIES: chromosomal replication initiator protein DnaA [Rhodomicrobium]